MGGPLRRRVALGGVLGQHPADDLLQPVGHRRVDLLQRPGRLGGVADHLADDVRVGEGRVAGQQVVQHAAEAVEVRADVGGVGVAQQAGAKNDCLLVAGQDRQHCRVGLHAGAPVKRLGEIISRAGLTIRFQVVRVDSNRRRNE